MGKADSDQALPRRWQAIQIANKTERLRWPIERSLPLILEVISNVGKIYWSTSINVERNFAAFWNKTEENCCEGTCDKIFKKRLFFIVEQFNDCNP